jgi:hypothetical protein
MKLCENMEEFRARYGTKRMKLRHVAALALVGWYLVIFPDPARLKKLKYPPQFTIWDTYPDKSSCKRALPELAKFVATDPDYASHGMRHTVACVVPDDPSLKGKAAVQRVKPN